MTEPTKEIIILENEYYDNNKTIGTCNARNSDIIQQLLTFYHGVKVGDIVIHKGNEYLVQSVYTLGGWGLADRTHKPWVTGYSKKKNGTFGAVGHCLYSEWEKK